MDRFIYSVVTFKELYKYTGTMSAMETLFALVQLDSYVQNCTELNATQIFVKHHVIQEFIKKGK